MEVVGYFFCFFVEFYFFNWEVVVVEFFVEFFNFVGVDWDLVVKF